MDMLVSVIMPIRNEEEFIELSLGAVLMQNYPPDRMEVLIADGMSNDDTRKIVKRLSSTTSIVIYVIDNPEQIVPTGLNRALMRTKGQIIVRVDGHTIIDPEYVTQCVRLLTETNAENVGGKMHAIGQNYIGKVIASATSSPFGVGNARFHYSDNEEYVDTVYMGAWRKTTFDRIGMFDEELMRNQDDEFNHRIRANGGQILLSPLIKSTYYSRNSLLKLMRQYFQYGIYKVRVMQKHPRQMRFRHFVPPIFVIALVGGLVLVSVGKWFRTLWLLVFGIYTCANLLASIQVAAKSRWRYLPSLPIVFFILHFSYGLGFLRGLIKFWNRWYEI